VLAERAYELSGDRIEGRAAPGRYASRDNFTGEPRTYVVVESADAEAVAPALEEVLRRPDVEAMTDGALKLMLTNARAKEGVVIRRLNPSIGLAPPPERVITRYWLWRLRPHLLRTPTNLGPNPETMCRVTAEARLYAERGIVVSTPDEVKGLYVEAFGAWPFNGDRDVETFYKGDYFRMWEIVDKAIAAFRAGPAGPTLRLGNDDDYFSRRTATPLGHGEGRF
jgi:hypothetical protein